VDGADEVILTAGPDLSCIGDRSAYHRRPMWRPTGHDMAGEEGAVTECEHEVVITGK
jgi:hypothetical protein